MKTRVKAIVAGAVLAAAMFGLGACAEGYTSSSFGVGLSSHDHRGYGYGAGGYGYGPGPGYGFTRGPRGDLDGDGIPNRFDRDRDGDGVSNRYDPRPDSPRWRHR